MKNGMRIQPHVFVSTEGENELIIEDFNLEVNFSSMQNEENTCLY